MNDLRKAPLFASLNDVIDDAVAFLQSDSLLLVTTADLTSVLALGFLESALLDRAFRIHGESFHQIHTFLRMKST